MVRTRGAAEELDEQVRADSLVRLRRPQTECQDQRGHHRGPLDGTSLAGIEFAAAAQDEGAQPLARRGDSDRPHAVRLGTMIRKFTVHRGMFDSIPAMLVFGGITFLVTGGSPMRDRYLMAGGVMGGFLSHLILDEIYAVEFKGGRWRTKKSFGTAP